MANKRFKKKNPPKPLKSLDQGGRRGPRPSASGSRQSEQPLASSTPRPGSRPVTGPTPTQSSALLLPGRSVSSFRTNRRSQGPPSVSRREPSSSTANISRSNMNSSRRSQRNTSRNDSTMPITPKSGGNRGRKFRREMHRLQRVTDLLIPRAPFSRLVKSVTQAVIGEVVVMRYSQTALHALQEAAEAFLVGFFEDSYLACRHRSKVTLTDRDCKLSLILRRDAALMSGRYW